MARGRLTAFPRSARIRTPTTQARGGRQMDGHLVPAVRQRAAEGVNGDAGARLEAPSRTPEHPGCSQRQEARARFDRPQADSSGGIVAGTAREERQCVEA